MDNETTPSCPLPFGGAKIEFPQTFEMRIIFEKQHLEALKAGLQAVFTKHAIPSDGMRELPGKGIAYSRLAVTVMFVSSEKMRACYEEIGSFPYVKGLF